MAAKQKTPEEIAAMEEEVRAYRTQEAQAKTEETRTKAKPLVDLVQGDAWKALEEALPAVQELANDSETYPHLRVHLDALRNGMFGLTQMVGFLPPDPATIATAPVEPAPQA